MRTPAAAVQDADVSVDVDTAKLRPVEKVVSARVTFDDQGEPTVQYLAKWKVRQDKHRHLVSFPALSPESYLPEQNGI